MLFFEDKNAPLAVSFACVLYASRGAKMVVVFICCACRNSAVTHCFATPAQWAAPLDPLKLLSMGEAVPTGFQ